MSTIAVVDVITQYLMIFGPLLGDIKRGFYLSQFRSTVNHFSFESFLVFHMNAINVIALDLNTLIGNPIRSYKFFYSNTFGYDLVGT